MQPFATSFEVASGSHIGHKVALFECLGTPQGTAYLPVMVTQHQAVQSPEVVSIRPQYLNFQAVASSLKSGPSTGIYCEFQAPLQVHLLHGHHWASQDSTDTHIRSGNFPVEGTKALLRYFTHRLNRRKLLGGSNLAAYKLTKKHTT